MKTMSYRVFTELIGIEDERHIADQVAEDYKENGAWLEVWVEPAPHGRWKVKGSKAVEDHI